ncbi:MAG: UvrD-helicase domain-containing protein, partial [Pseudomonadota bacterium]
MTAIVYQPTAIIPTAEQSAIQSLKHKRVLVEANAGAAKTTTLALRVAQALARGAEPQRLLVLTYTAAAVQAFFKALDLIGVSTPRRQGLRVQTFDAFCAHRLEDIEGSGVPFLATPEQLRTHVLQATQTLLDDPRESHPQALWPHIGSEAAVESLLEAFACLKGTLLLAMQSTQARFTPESALAQWGQDYTVLRAFQRCESQRHDPVADRAAYRTHGDATCDLALRLIDDDAVFDDPHPLALGLHLVVVDEMHDTNRAMFTVLQHVLRHNPRAAFVGVGDRDQVIHAVAGADAAFMGSAFEAEIGPAVRMPLTASYRFGP